MIGSWIGFGIERSISCCRFVESSKELRLTNYARWRRWWWWRRSWSWLWSELTVIWWWLLGDRTSVGNAIKIPREKWNKGERNQKIQSVRHENVWSFDQSAERMIVRIFTLVLSMSLRSWNNNLLGCWWLWWWLLNDGDDVCYSLLHIITASWHGIGSEKEQEKRRANGKVVKTHRKQVKKQQNTAKLDRNNWGRK